MARTYNDIYYNDDENSIAEILDDMKKLAESVDQQIGSIKSFNNDTSQFIEQVTPLMNNLSEQVIDMHQLADTMFTELEQVKEENKQLREDLESDYEEKTVEGTDIEVNDSAEMRCELKISGNSEQETREGYNLLPNNATTMTKNGITFTVNEDGSVIIDGTAEAQADLALFGKYNNTSNTFTINGTVTFGLISNNNNVQLILVNEGTNQLGLATSSETLELTEDTYVNYAIIRVLSGATIPNQTFYPMIRSGSKLGEYEQYGASPSPDYPSEVKSCGDNINIFDGEVEEGNIDASTGQNAVATNAWRSKNYLNVKDTSVSISVKDLTFSGTVGRLYFYKSDNTYISNILINSLPFTTTLPNETAKVRFFILNAVADINSKVKLSKGTSTGEYSEYGQGCASVKIQNKNLFDENNKISGLTISSDGKIISNNERELIIIKVKPNTVYTFSRATPTESGNVVWGISDNKPFVNEKCTYNIMASSITNIQIKTGIKTKYIIFRTSKDNGITNNKYYIKAMIEENKVATNYISHEEQSFTMPCQKEMIDKEDYFDTKNYKEVHNWGKLILTGNENITYDSASMWMFRLKVSDIKQISSNDIETQALCNILKSRKWNGPQGYDNVMSQLSNTTMIGIRSTQFKNLEALKSYLKSQYNAGTPVTIYYKLTTPEQIEMTLEQKRVSDEIEKAKSYYETTIVTSEDEIQPNLEFTYKRSNKLRIENMEKALLSQGGGV